MQTLPRDHRQEQERHPGEVNGDGKGGSECVHVREDNAREHLRREDSPQVCSAGSDDEKRGHGARVVRQARDKTVEEGGLRIRDAEGTTENLEDWRMLAE